MRYSCPPLDSEEVFRAKLAAAPVARPPAPEFRQPLGLAVADQLPAPPSKEKAKRRRAGSPTPRKKQRRRAWTFGLGAPRPLSSADKARIMNYAQNLRKNGRQKGHPYGAMTPKYLDVLEALLYGFHNGRSGMCLPSYATIAERAECSPSTVRDAIHRMEALGLLNWTRRMKWKKADEHGVKRAVRTSNSYVFNMQPSPLSPGFPSLVGTPLVTTSQVFFSSTAALETPSNWLPPQDYEALSP